MGDYIEREAVINMLENAQIISDGENCGYCTEDISIYSIPLAQVRKDVYAVWKYHAGIGPFGEDWINCSNCGARNEAKIKFKYCPYCGARMIRSEK